MDGGSGSNAGGHDPGWKYRTTLEGNGNGTICNFCGLVMENGELTRLKFHLSHTYPHSNSKKCSNVPLEVKQETIDLS